MNIGEVKREANSVYICRGPVTYTFLQIDLRLAIDFYGFLISPCEQITVMQWIKRIRRNYSMSKKRNHLIKAIITASRRELPKRLRTH